MKYIKKNSILTILVIITCLGMALRFYNLGKNPVGLSNDEIDLVMSAKFFSLTGSDLTGDWKVWRVEPILTETVMAEFAGLIPLFTVLFLPQNIFSAKIIFAIFSTLMIPLIYLFSKKLFNNEKIGLITALVMALNPWGIMFGRTGFEAPVATFFYLVFGTIMLMIPKSQKKLQLSILASVAFFVAFFLYHGLKIFALAFFFSAIFYIIWQQKKLEPKKIALIFKPTIIFACTFLLIVFFTILASKKLTIRESELIPLNIHKYQDSVNKKRLLSLDSPLTLAINNKYTHAGLDILDRYIKTFNTQSLFLSGDDRSSYSTRESGYFYLLDFFLILSGLIFLYTKKYETRNLLVVWILVAPLASALNRSEFQIIFRSALLFPFLVTLIGLGTYHHLQNLNKLPSKIKNAIIFIFLILYTLQITNFLFIYHVRYPVFGSEGFGLKDRLLSKYLDEANNESNSLKTTIILTESPYHAFRNTLFYRDLVTKKNVYDLQNQFKQKFNSDYTIKNSIFTSNCQYLTDVGTKYDIENTTLIIDKNTSGGCEKEITAYKEKLSLQNNNMISAIPATKDSGEDYKIFNDITCYADVSKSYIKVQNINDFSVENMPRDKFCQMWITTPSGK